MKKTACVVIALGVSLAGCPLGKPNLMPNAANETCGGLNHEACNHAQGLLAAASGFSNVAHEFLLDSTSTMAPGRGVERHPAGAWSPTPTQCAEAAPHLHDASIKAEIDAPADEAALDFTYVGLAVDQTLISTDADLTPFLSVGVEGSMHTVRLVALAFVRDHDPQFFQGTSNISYEREQCQCGRATHFIGSVKYGGMLAFETTVKTGEVHGKALEFVKAKLAASSADLRQVSAGGLIVEGLENALKNGTTTPLKFHVEHPVPVAYAVYPVTDVCRFAFPAPEVAPNVVDFGEVPAGREATRFVHIQNRASLDIRAFYNEQTFSIPAQSSLDIAVAFNPESDAMGCESAQREESLLFLPANKDAPALPKQHMVRLTKRAQTGRATLQKRARIDTGEARSPDYNATAHTLSCPVDYALAGCRAEKPECGDGHACSTEGYGITAEEVGGECHFACKGPHSFLTSSNYCRFDAVAECRLKCGHGAKAAPKPLPAVAEGNALQP